MSTTDTTTTGDEKHAIAVYLSDMIALHTHLAQPLNRQISSDDHNAYPEAQAIFTKIKSISDAHVSALQTRLAAVGGDAPGGVKTTVAGFVGQFAAGLNSIRKTKVSKSLRDDYTVLGLTAISYTMLHATACGLGDGATAALAKRGLEDITPIIVEISQVIPSVVLQELKEDGEPVQVSAAQLTERMSQEAWSPN